jgi:hypothetical protein
MDNSLLVIIIILCIIAITLYVNTYYLNKEGLDNPFSFIIKLFQAIGEIFSSIFTIFGLIGDIFDIISCPYRIFSNIGKCAGYWFFDIFFWGFYLILWAIIFWPLALLLNLGFLSVCFATGNWCNIFLTAEDICTKEGFFKFWDYSYFILFETKFLYRDEGDIDDCYCYPPLKYALDPLEEKLDLPDVEEEGSKSNPILFIFAVSVLCFLYVKSQNV